MAGKTIPQRVDRLERVVQVIAEEHLSLERTIAQLATETRRGFEQVANQFAETDRRMEERSRQTDERFRQTDERFRQTGERIDNLVVAVGELIRRQNGRGR